jgi:hypothetical protein
MAIKIFKSSDLGAPVLCGQLGQMITFLDAVLQDGYGAVNVSSLTRLGGTATVTTATPHGLSTGDSATINGADQTDYNIDAVVTVLNPTTFTYDVANSPATPATGAITAKRSPVGYTKVFSGPNKAVYRCNALSSNRHYLQVLDDGGGSGGVQEARVAGYESMTDVDTGVNRFPTVAQSPYGYLWRKSDATDSSPRTWIVISDGKFFYLMVQTSNPTLNMTNQHFGIGGAFGDVISYKPGDVWATFLTGNSSQNDTRNNAENGLMAAQTGISAPGGFGTSAVLARNYTAIPGARYVGLRGNGLSEACLGSNPVISYPHLIDSGFYMTPVVITQRDPALIRGRLPGAYESLHGRALNNLDIIENVQGLPGRKFMCLYGNNNYLGWGGSWGHLMIDITGPWDS